MFVYELYKNLIKNGDNEMWEYFGFVFFALIGLPIDIIFSPLELIAFIMWKLGGKTK